jgi:hypothetical protein
MKTKPIPIALPHDLLQQVDEVQALTGMSKADIMRLCMRIGLIDLKSAEHDLPGIVKRIADDAGVSFSSFAEHRTAANTPSKGGTLIAPLRITDTARIHSLNEDATPYVTDDTHLDRSISNLTAQVNDDLAQIRTKKTRKA